MYLVYSRVTGRVWREVEQYERLPDGGIHAGLGGLNTLTYPPSVGADIMEVSDSVWETMDREHPERYKIVDGAAVYEPEESPEWDMMDRLDAQITYTAMMTDTLLEVG